MRNSPKEEFEIDGAYGLLFASLVLKLLWLQPELGLFSPAEKVLTVFIRNRLTALCCHFIFGLFLLSLTCLVFQTRNARLSVAVLLQVVLIPIAYIDLTYARFQGSFISSSQISLWREGFSALTTLRSYVDSKDILLLIDIPIGFLFYCLACTVRTLRTTRRIMLLTAFLTGTSLLGVTLHLWCKCNSPDVLARPYNRRFTSPVIWMVNGIRHCMASDRYILPTKIPKGLQSVESASAKKKHIVFLQIESLQSGAVEWLHSGQRVMPFTYELSLAHPYTATAISPRKTGVSFDTDIAVLTGFQPPESSDPYNYGFDHPPYFPHLLKRRGYATVTWDNYLPEFYKGKENHSLLGMETYHSIRDRKWYSILPRLSSVCPGDYEFLQTVAKHIKGTKKATFFHIKTVSSHGPWNGLESHPEVMRIIGKPFPHSGHRLDGYAAILRYLDTSIRAFVTELNQLINEERLLLVIFGDHGAGLPIPTPTLKAMSVKGVREKCVPLLFLGLNDNTLAKTPSLNNLPATVAIHLQLPYEKGELGGYNMFSASNFNHMSKELLEFGYGKLSAPK